MAIGLVSDDEFEKEFSSQSDSSQSHSSSKESHPVTEVITPKGRKEGDNNVPESLRKIIGETHLLEGRQSALDLASQFGVSSSSVSAYAKGATSTTTYNSPSKSLIGHINKSRQRAIHRAQSTLNKSLSSISQEKLDYSDAKDLSAIAKDMSVIIKNLEPQSPQESQSTSNVQFTIYAPTFRAENSYEVIQSEE